MIRCLLIYGFLITACAVPGIANAREWTLDDAVKTAVNASHSARVERLEADAASLDTENASAHRYPTLSASASANVVSEVMKLETPVKSIQFGDYDSYDISLRIRQIIYDGGRYSYAGKAAEARHQARLSRAEAGELTAEFEIKSAFYTLLLAEQSAKAVREAINEAENHLHDVEALRDQGMALENDVLRARLRISTARMDLTSREADIERAKAQFRDILGIESDDEVALVWNDTGIDNSDPETNTSLLFDRPEFRAFEAASRSSQYTARSIRSATYPTVSLSGGLNYGQPGLDPPANDWMHYFSAGITVNWNMWDWNIADREAEKAFIETRKIEADREDFTQEMLRRYREAVTALNEAESRAELAEESAEYARRNLELITASYREGMSKETDYDNAHVAYTKAGIDLAASRIMIYLRVAAVEYICGIRYTEGSHE